MNIFYLDENPELAAQYQCDKHVVKMVLETAQLLSAAHRVLDGDNSGILPDYREEILYKLTHKNHPCTIWTRQSYRNYIWLAAHGYALCKEYTRRYGKVHKTQGCISELIDYHPDNIYDLPFEQPPQCMPDYLKVPDNAVQAYRNYYNYEKSRFALWKYTEKPSWFKKLDSERK